MKSCTRISGNCPLLSRGNRTTYTLDGAIGSSWTLGARSGNTVLATPGRRRKPSASARWSMRGWRRHKKKRARWRWPLLLRYPAPCIGGDPPGLVGSTSVAREPQGSILAGPPHRVSTVPDSLCRIDRATTPRHWRTRYVVAGQDTTRRMVFARERVASTKMSSGSICCSM